MNKAEAYALLEEIAQDPRIAENDFGYNMAVTGNIDGTYYVEVDFYPDPIKTFGSRDTWLEWKRDKGE